MSGGNGHDGSEGGRSQWWLDPALAQLAFGRSTRASRTWRPPVDSDSPFADMRDRRLRIDLDDPLQREFGDYELLEVVGEGGMGVVYRARQRNLNREVAIKLLSAGAAASDEIIDTLRSEAQNAAQLQHPNIVVVHELGEYGGLIFYAMQLVRGRSLSHVLEARHTLPPIEAAALIKRVAEGVHYAHRLGVLHLDLKPGNILVGEDGEPRIADFGLARRLEQALAVANERVAGTPSYMAPEQAQVQGPALSAATDVYGLGAVLYELLTGAPPFLADDPHATLRQVLDAPLVPPRQRNAAIPRDLEAIVLRCLAREPGQRYPGAGALAEDLGNFLAGRPVQARPLNPLQRAARFARREPRLAVVILLALLALLVGVVATTLQWRRAEHNATAASMRLWESRREAALRSSQDGKGFDALPQLLQNIDEEERTGNGELAALERRRMGMLLGQGVVLVDRLAIADANPLCAEVSPDGRLLALGLNDQSVRWYDTATLRERGRASLRGRISSGGESRAPMLLRFVDDHRLRVTLDWYGNLVSPGESDSWLLDLDRGAVIEPPEAFADFADANYSGDGRYALLRNHRRGSQLWQVAPWRPLSPMIDDVSGDYLPWLLGPDARYAAFLSLGMRPLYLYDLPAATPHTVAIPGNASISAWNRSKDGRWLALGDFEGRVFVLDTRTRAMRTMPTGRGREITWVEFSEDDAWLAAGSWDGTAYAFDVAGGNALMSMPLHHDFTLRRLGISHARRLLVAAGEGQVALWRLPLPGPRGLPAQRIGLAPARHGVAGQYAVGWSLDSGLLATAGLDGQVRLWRLPLSTMAAARAARQIPEKTWFDGRHLVDVQGDRLRIASLAGRARGRWLRLPQAPGFAELVDGGRTLLVTLGPSLRVYDAATLHLRAPAIALPDTPQKLLASDDGARVLLTFGAHGSDGFEEHLRQFDLRHCRALAGETILPGPLRRLAYSADGARVLAVGTPDGATTVLGSDGLRRIGEFPHDPFQPVLWADFAADNRRVALVASAQDPRLGEDSLQWWDPSSDRTQVLGTGQARPLGVIATARGAFVAGARGELIDQGNGRLQALPQTATSEPTAAMALSADGRFVAQGFRHEVQLYDVASGATIGLPLQLDTQAMDTVVALAFAPDGRRLLARTALGYWQAWPIAAEPRPAADIAIELARLSVDRENQQRVHVPTASDRAALRAGDPGPWPRIEPRPVPSAAAWVGAEPIPARDAGTSPLLLDMSRVYAIAPDTVRNTYYSVEPMMRYIAVGTQRFGGIDFDLRGMLEIGSLLDPRDHRLATRIACLPLPAVAVAAIRPLLQTSVRSPFATGERTGTVRLHYRDGGSVELPLQAGREVPGYDGDDRDVPAVYAPRSGLPAMGLADVPVYAPRLANPHPDRLVRCLDVEATQLSAPFIVYAITAEPVIGGASPRTSHVVPPAGAPVSVPSASGR
jgi:WD40 repeat protein